jgi:uncharacterized membrane protein
LSRAVAAVVVHSFTHIACPSSVLARRVLFVTVTDADGWRDPECADDSVVPPNVRRVARLEEQQLRARSTSERIAGALTQAAGTATFAITHLVWFIVWIGVNAGWVRGIGPFDPFPFNLLTMVVSLESIFLSIWILISQNQMTRQAERRAHLDLQINLLAEQESTATLRIVRRIAERLDIERDRSPGDASLAEETDIEGLVSKMDEALPDAPDARAEPPGR